MGTVVLGAVAPAFAIDVEAQSIVAVNDRLLSLIGRQGDDLTGQHCSEICAGTPLGSCSDSACPVASAFGSGDAQSATISLIGSGGQLLPATITGVLADTGIAFISSVATLEDGAAADADPWQVRVQTLGGFSVVSATGEELTPRRARTLSLFKLLLTRQGAPLSESEALRAFWPDSAPERALNGLQVLVHDLRRTLEPDLTNGRHSRFIVRQSDSYLLAPDAPIEIDMQTFVRAAAAAHTEATAGNVARAQEHARAALQAYTGDLFESDDEARWFADQRRQLRETRIDVMLLLARLLADLGDRHGALEQCRAAAAADVLREDVHRLLIVLLARESGRVAASQYFIDMFSAFKARSGLPPSRETADLVDRIVNAEDLDEIESELASPVAAHGEAAPS